MAPRRAPSCAVPPLVRADVEYCPTCGVPRIYCRFVGHKEADASEEDHPSQAHDSGKILIKVKNRTKRKFITSVSGFETLNLNPKNFERSLKKQLNTGCSTQPSHNGVKLVIQGDVGKEVADFCKTSLSIPPDKITVIPLKKPPPDPIEAQPVQLPKGLQVRDVPEPPWEGEIPRQKEKSLLKRRTASSARSKTSNKRRLSDDRSDEAISEEDDLPEDMFEDIRCNFNGNANRYVRVMRAFILCELELLKVEKAKLTMEDQRLEFDCGSTDRSECPSCEHPMSIRHFITHPQLPRICPHCEHSLEKVIPKRSRWLITFPAPSWYFMTEQEIELHEISNSHVNDGDGIILLWENDSKSMKGRVVSVRDHRIRAVFQLEDKELPPDYFPPDAQTIPRLFYKVKFTPKVTTLKRQAAALDYLRSGIWPQLKKIILGHIPQRRHEMPRMDDASYEFEEVKFIATPSQTQAVKHVLNSSIALVQGPPGCGKTQVITACVINLLLDPTKEGRILVCGPSNVSVENIVRALLPGVRAANRKLVWLATAARDVRPSRNQGPEYTALCFQQILTRNSREAREFQQLDRDSLEFPWSFERIERMQKLRDIMDRQICKEADVVCCTLDSSANRALSELRFPFVFVDEATQAVEPSTLISLVHEARNLFLFGDQKQLGPVVRESAFKRHGYDRSLFERLIDLGLEFVCLKKQFRMHPAIRAFPSQCFYGGQLSDGITIEDRRSPPLLCFPVERLPLLFWNVDGKESSVGKSFANDEEADCVKRVANILMAAKMTPSQIGIITPYRAQVPCLRRKLPHGPYSQLKIATVDSFQGGERDYIIISCVRNGGEIGFLSDDRRLNVSLTRARFGLIIIGNANTLAAGSPTWSQLVDHFANQNALRADIPRFQIQKKVTTKIEIVRAPQAQVTTVFGEEEEGEAQEIPIEDGFHFQCILSPISGRKYRIIWPENNEDIDVLVEWVNDLRVKLDEGQSITLSFDAECIDENPLCFEFHEFFNESVDPIDSSSPGISSPDGFIVFCMNQDGVLNPERIFPILEPLFSHEGLTIVTFDVTKSILLLEQIGIQLHADKLIDLLLSNAATDSNLLTSQRCTLFQISSDIPDCHWSPEIRSILLEFVPWEANAFILEIDSLPPTAVVTRHFLEYTTCTLTCIDKLFIHAIQHDNKPGLVQSTQREMEEYRAAVETHGPRGPYLVRHAELIRLEIPMLLSFGGMDAETIKILGHWYLLKELSMIKTASETLIRDSIQIAKLQTMLQEYLQSLKSQDRLIEIRKQAKLVPPPGCTWTRYFGE